ncbi:basic blue protein-like [Cornus florida]|uniref:basic blue protein-like n=1 Tax=Cornus florida TaxID=4283 RepID=UPI002897FBA5|nr:basic blue protein-like [Cornus florida]
MSQRRGIAGPAMFIVVAQLCLLVHFEPVHGVTYLVNGGAGWNSNQNVSNWPNGKHFKAGDKLVFNYDKSLHDVAVVNQDGYNSCKTPAGSKVFHTGLDAITLPKGQNYFISDFPGDCDSGMKITVNAE